MRFTLIILILLASCSSSKKVPGQAERPVQVKLNGSDSFDPDGYIVKYFWRQILGIPAKIFKPEAVITNVEIKVKGQTAYELTVTDDDGATGKDTIVIEKKY